MASRIDRPPPVLTPQLLWSGAHLMRRPGAALGASKTTWGRRYRLKSTARTKRPPAWTMGHEAARRRVPRLGTRSASQQTRQSWLAVHFWCTGSGPPRRGMPSSTPCTTSSGRNRARAIDARPLPHRTRAVRAPETLIMGCHTHSSNLNFVGGQRRRRGV